MFLSVFPAACMNLRVTCSLQSVTKLGFWHIRHKMWSVDRFHQKRARSEVLYQGQCPYGRTEGEKMKFGAVTSVRRLETCTHFTISGLMPVADFFIKYVMQTNKHFYANRSLEVITMFFHLSASPYFLVSPSPQKLLNGLWGEFPYL